ncbi:MAG: TVP38/TMEM64 family protein [Clostridia bacterium]|nr:TVP38/TMEM64 family protein [Clostridia bacterium]
MKETKEKIKKPKENEDGTPVSEVTVLKSGNAPTEEEAVSCGQERTVKKEGYIKRKLKSALHAFLLALHDREAVVRHIKAKRIAVLAFLLFFLVSTTVFFVTVGQKIELFVKDPEGFKSWLDSFGAGSVTVFVVLRVLQTVLRIVPGGALQLAGGCVFGTWGGLLWCLVGSLIGTLIILILSRCFGTRLVGLFVSPERVKSFSLLKDKKKRNFVFFLLYLVPGVPKDVFAWVAGVTDENIFEFLLISTIGRLPSVLVSTWCGAELVSRNYMRAVIIFAAVIVAGVVFGFGYRYFAKKHRQAIAEKKEAAEKEEKIPFDRIRQTKSK